MMKAKWLITPGMFWGTAGVLCLTVALCAEPAGGGTDNSNGNKKSAADSKVHEKLRVPVEVARDRAKLMHDIYSATLDVMHHRYFHGERAVVPARAMEDVFSEIKLHSKAEARWIAVSVRAMSIDHEPKTEFEKKAASEIAAGKSEVEAIEGGYYRRAGAIRLTDGCISCHGGFFKETAKYPKYAGLVISVPVTGEPGKLDEQSPPANPK